MSAGQAPRWHALGTDEVFRELSASPGGLREAEAAERLERNGPNEVEVARPVSTWRILAHQVRSVVVGLLVGAAALALVLGDGLDALAIAVVLVINVAVGFWTEWRARVAVEGLRSLQVEEAVVVRDGHRRRVDARVIVPGDVMLLGEGDVVAADARIVEASELRLNEAPLTGESLPVGKRSLPVEEPEGGHTSLADRVSMVYKGTTVAGGAGRGVVTATGGKTEIGRIGELVGSLTQSSTPIERRLSALGRRLVWITLGIAGVVIVLGVASGRDLWLVVETGLALAIAAVPEGLPVVATVTLAVGMWRMARRNALVRRPPAVEALGSATVICADKTGTLTTGRMTATVLWVEGRRVEVAGVGLELEGALTSEGRDLVPADLPGLSRSLRISVLANEASLERTDTGVSVLGDPTDVALLVLGAKAGLDRDQLVTRWPQVARMPFSSSRMAMASFHRADAGVVEVCAKGAADRILARCSHWLGPGGREPLDEAGRREVLEVERSLAADGLRVLALAFGECPAEEAGREDALERLTLAGLVGMMDPPAPRVKETVARFRNAGVRTVMITGDQPVTARSVAEQLDMVHDPGDVIAGPRLATMSREELREAVGRVTVFGRVSPEDKVRIVEALQERGEVVGMLGDGVNDGPALKRADIGVAMGRRGTDVAREIADLVLADDRLETVAVAVEEGRVIFDNIRKFIFFLFSCNVSEVGVVFLASVLTLPLPLLPLQLLWLNVVTDVFPALALAVEPGEPDVMRRPPRPQSSAILSVGFLVHLLFYGTLITSVSLAVFVWGLREGGKGVEHAMTLTFMTLALTQLVHVQNARTFGPLDHRRLGANPWLWGALVLSLGLQLLAVGSPALARVLGTRALGPLDWAVVVGAALVPLVAGQLWKKALEVRAARLGAGSSQTPVADFGDG